MRQQQSHRATSKITRDPVGFVYSPYKDCSKQTNKKQHMKHYLKINRDVIRGKITHMANPICRKTFERSMGQMVKIKQVTNRVASRGQVTTDCDAGAIGGKYSLINAITTITTCTIPYDLGTLPRY